MHTAKPEDAGLSSQPLNGLKAQAKADADGHRIPGVVFLVAHNGKIAMNEAIGFESREDAKAMRSDSIFRIASMTKPVISVAVLMLAEEGKLDLDAPLSQYLPEFRGLTVGTTGAMAKKPVTILDMLRHTAGFTYGLFSKSPVDDIYKQSRVLNSTSLKEMVSRAAALPLAHQPGEVWEYSISTDLLGRVIEVVSGKTLDKFISERITNPLKMPDTLFYLNAEQAKRFARSDLPISMGVGDPTAKPLVFSGGGGLYSTAGDYARFCQMLLNGGELQGVRILSAKSVERMTTDQLAKTIDTRPGAGLGIESFAPGPETGTGFGLGFAIKTAEGNKPLAASVSSYWWAGSTGTFFWVDPKQKLVGVLMIQVPQATGFAYWRRMQAAVYQALAK